MTKQGVLGVAGPKVKRTEREMLNMLRRRHVRPGNGGAGEYAFMTHVRNSAGFNSTRTFDAVVMGLWPSRGLELHAYEVKCSRTDWLRELKDPAKAEAAAKLVDRFSVVAADDTIVADGELPSTWGLLVARGSKLVSLKDAPLLPDADSKRPVGRPFLVAMLRAGGAVPAAEAEEVRLARAEGYAQAQAAHKASMDTALEQHNELRRRVATFEREAGVGLGGWQGDDPARVGRALKAVLSGDRDAERSLQQLRQVQTMLRRAADDLDRYSNPLSEEVRT